ncbi:MAG: response regulator, partial [Vallitaleaceae bacterium]|nr:response regulator [Vallitaleaceae bacterium]
DISERKHFEKAITQAEASNDAKSTFLANMSHEIRTPLNAIIGINYLIQKTPLSDIQRGYVERTILAARNLLGNVNDVLDFSKIEANKLTLELEVFDLYEVINNVASIVSFNLYEKQLKLWIIIDPSIPQMIIGDAHKLNQILLNIINNSVKFTEQGEIKITVSNKDMSDSSIRLTFNVEDTGIGMKEEQQKGIFSAFSQADNSTTRKYGGTGLGLSISKKLVELMDGHISVSSVEGVGTTFSFTAEFAWKKQCIGDIKRLKELQFLEVLFISDDEHMKAVFKNQFELLGITYDDAEHITEAIQYIQNKKSYHTVLLDWKLLNKHTAIEQIKALILRPDLKIILVSTSREYSIEMLEYDNTISAIIYNPIGLRQLYNKLARIFSNLKSLEIESLDTRVAIKQGHTLKNVRVLIVEDNELNRELVIAILEEYGLIIDSAENGRIAIEKILKAPYDLVLMDLQMPVMDGYEATRKIREMDDFKDLPIIAMSAHAIKGIEEITYEVGMNDYITKPFEVSKMISTLEFWAKKNF